MREYCAPLLTLTDIIMTHASFHLYRIREQSTPECCVSQPSCDVATLMGFQGRWGWRPPLRPAANADGTRLAILLPPRRDHGGLPQASGPQVVPDVAAAAGEPSVCSGTGPICLASTLSSGPHSERAASLLRSSL